jgi:hypothetical protein
LPGRSARWVEIIAVSGCGSEANRPDEVAFRHANQLARVADVLESVRTKADADASADTVRQFARDSASHAPRTGTVDNGTEQQKLSPAAEEELRR